MLIFLMPNLIIPCSPVISHANFFKVYFEHVSIREANLSNAKLENAKLIDVHLHRSNLSHANLSNAIMIINNIEYTDL